MWIPRSFTSDETHEFQWASSRVEPELIIRSSWPQEIKVSDFFFGMYSALRIMIMANMARLDIPPFFCFFHWRLSVKGQRSEGWIGQDVRRVMFLEHWCNVNRPFETCNKEKSGARIKTDIVYNLYLVLSPSVSYHCFPQEEQVESACNQSVVCYIELQTNLTGSRWRKVEFWEPLAHILLDFNFRNLERRVL